MAKKKLKSKFVKLLLFILFIILICVIYFCIIGDNIKNISISGNNYLKDNEIIELAGLSDYDGFLKKTSNSIIKKLKTNILIDDVKIKKKIDKTIIINVTEKKILFRNSNTDKYVLSDGKEYAFDNSYNVPLLINFVPDEVYESFVKEYKKLDLIIIDKISEIKYSPNQYDDDLFLLYMNDKNLVQVTASKLTSVNKYNEIVTKLNGKNGILYLDSGSYFKIME
jgi:cell division protein FtsQ